MNLENVFAINAVVIVLKWTERAMVSEQVRDYIAAHGGKRYSVETIGRRLRQQAGNGFIGSKDFKANGNKYKKFFYVEQQG